MRILFVADAAHAPLAGVGRVALTLARELVGTGHEVISLDWRSNPLMEGVSTDSVVLTPRSRWAPTAFWHLDLLRRIPTLGIDHDVLFDPSGYPSAFGRSDRLVLQVHDLSMFGRGQYRPGKRQWFQLFYGRALRLAAKLVCGSEHTREELLRRFDLERDRCVVVHDALDPGISSLIEARPSPVVPPPYLLAVGILEERKNPQRLLEAYAAARSADLSEPLVLVGRPGHGSGEAIALIAKLGLTDHVSLLGAVDEPSLAALYAHAKALLYPSLEEGFGLPLLEAMYAGIPVLTSDRSALPEVAGDAALYVDPENVDSIRDGIVRLSADERLRQQLVSRGRERVKQFSAGAQAERMVRVFEEVMEGTTS